jgi:hypothetical protein
MSGAGMTTTPGEQLAEQMLHLLLPTIYGKPVRHCVEASAIITFGMISQVDSLQLRAELLRAFARDADQWASEAEAEIVAAGAGQP